MSSYENKVICFYTSLANTYKEDEEREYFQKLKFQEKELTEDFTAMISAMHVMYSKITGEEIDLLGFTYVLNRLAVQHGIDAQTSK